MEGLALLLSLSLLFYINLLPQFNFWQGHELENALEKFVQNATLAQGSQLYSERSFSRRVQRPELQELENDPLSYQIFRLGSLCNKRCAQRVMRSLREIKCSNVAYLESLHLIEGRCDGVKELSAHQIGEFAVQHITSLEKHYDNVALQPPGDEDVVKHGDRQGFYSNYAERLSLRQHAVRQLPFVGRKFVQDTGDLWGLDKIDQLSGADHFLNLSCFPNLGKGVNIYVLDSGCRTTHIDFSGRNIEAVIPDDSEYNHADDQNGHGTHIAGTAAGNTYGVCKMCNIVCVKTLDHNNMGFIRDVMLSIDHVIDHKENHPQAPGVAILSLGDAIDTDLMDDGMALLEAAGVIPVVAAGNGGTDACLWTPARSTSAITVTASTENDVKRSKSNGGACIDIAAPGVDIISAGIKDNTAETEKTGTSMAAPHVAGAIGLLLGENPSLSKDDVLDLLTRFATDIRDWQRGTSYKLVNIQRNQCSIYTHPHAPPTPSASRTPRPTRSPSPSPSASRSSSPSPSRTASPSASRTPQPTRTPSATPQPSMTPSSSTSPSPSKVPLKASTTTSENSGGLRAVPTSTVVGGAVTQCMLVIKPNSDAAQKPRQAQHPEASRSPSPKPKAQKVSPSPKPPNSKASPTHTRKPSLSPSPGKNKAGAGKASASPSIRPAKMPPPSPSNSKWVTPSPSRTPRPSPSASPSDISLLIDCSELGPE